MCTSVLFQGCLSCLDLEKKDYIDSRFLESVFDGMALIFHVTM